MKIKDRCFYMCQTGKLLSKISSLLKLCACQKPQKCLRGLCEWWHFMIQEKMGREIWTLVWWCALFKFQRPSCPKHVQENMPTPTQADVIASPKNNRCLTIARDTSACYETTLLSLQCGPLFPANSFVPYEGKLWRQVSVSTNGTATNDEGKSKSPQPPER